MTKNLHKIFLSLCFSLLIFTNFLNAQNQYSSYFPIKEGNVWVYSYYNTQFGQSGRFSRTISENLVVNGHKYLYYNGQYQRVDSVNANIYFYTTNGGCSWLQYEKTADSLAARMNDTVKTGCGISHKLCIDTNQRVLFGTGRRTKNIGLGSSGIVYAKDFGIMELYTQSGNVYYVENLIGCILNGIVYGDTSLTGITQISRNIPESFSLSQNYPNPFNPSTNIGFRIPKSEFVNLKVHDLIGREVAQLVNEELKPGIYSIDWNAENYPSGIYLYTINAGSFTDTKKMVLIK